MAIKDDARLPLFVFRKQAGAIGTQLCENHVQGFFTVPILESRYEDAVGVFGAQVMSQLYFAANGIIGLNYASNKANDNHGRLSGSERHGRN